MLNKIPPPNLCPTPIYPTLVGRVGLSLLGGMMAVAVTASPAAASLARILSIEGEVELQREGWDTFQPTGSGTALSGSDLLYPTRGSRVEVLCPNGATRWLVPAGIISAVNNGCPGTPERLRPQFSIGDLRGGSDPSLPYVITPRTGLVVETRPSLSWNSVEGVERYTVTLEARGEVIWQIETSDSAIPYPADQPELLPRQLYTLTVVTDTGASSAQEELPLRFNLLTADQAAAAQAEIDATHALEGLSDELKTLILVEEVYPNYPLTAAAITDLRRLIASGIETAQVYRLLGDLYLTSGLRLLAEASYVQAIALAIPSGHVEAQVLAHLGLGTLYSQIGETAKAIQQLRCAQAGAAQLGDARLTESIAAALAELFPSQVFPNPKSPAPKRRTELLLE